MNNNTLHLSLKKRWFDMITSGEKREEYREISETWIRRFVRANVIVAGRSGGLIRLPKERVCGYVRAPRRLLLDYWLGHIVMPIPARVRFSLGYPSSKEADKWAEYELKSIRIDFARPEWAPEDNDPNKLFFVLQLGQRVTINP